MSLKIFTKDFDYKFINIDTHMTVYITNTEHTTVQLSNYPASQISHLVGYPVTLRYHIYYYPY